MAIKQSKQGKDRFWRVGAVHGGKVVGVFELGCK